MKKIISILLICVLSFSLSACMLNENVKKSQIAKDKSVIEMLRTAILASMTDDVDVKINSKGAKVDSEKIMVADLFDISDEATKEFVEDVEDAFDGDGFILASSMNKDCIVKIVLFDSENLNVVIQVESEAADMEFYIDGTGSHDGTYK